MRVADKKPRLDLKVIHSILNKNQYLPIPELPEYKTPEDNNSSNRIHYDIGESPYYGVILKDKLKP